MSRLKRKKKVFLFCNKFLIESLKRELGNIFEITEGKTVTQIKEVKPYAIIFDKETESILKYSTKKTYLMYLSTPEVFSGILELGFQSKDMPNPHTKEGEEIYRCETLIKERGHSLILRLASLITYEDLEEIKKSIIHRIALDNRVQLYPMYPPDVARVIDTLLSLESKGVVHLRGSERTTQYKIGLILSDIFKLIPPVSSFDKGGDIKLKLA